MQAEEDISELKMDTETMSMNFFITKDNMKRYKKQIEDIKEELEKISGKEN